MIINGGKSMSGHMHSGLSNFEEREKILPSQKILSNFGIHSGQHLADLGAGYGFFAIRAAEMVGEHGRIEAIDIEPERLQSLLTSAEERGVFQHIRTHLAEGETIPLPPDSVDVALISTVLHELHDPLSYLQEARRIVKEQGEIWVIEWQNKVTKMGPPLAERRSIDHWVSLLEQAGFENIWVQTLEPGFVLIKGNLTRVK
jgi:ubiquinone/menaquinone biosynthesis C-methylase UbiE